MPQSLPNPLPLWRRGAVLLAACAMATACTTVLQPGQPPVTTLSTLNGPVPLNPLGPTGFGPGGNLAMPPPGLEGTSQIETAGVPRSGAYTGYADVLSTGGGLCLNDKTVSNFQVRGDQVRFGEMRGTIASNGGLQMVFGNVWIVGTFQGPTFRGQMLAGGPAGCSFALELDRVGP